MSAAASFASNCCKVRVESKRRNALLNSRRYFRPALESLWPRSRRTAASACICAAARRDCNSLLRAFFMTLTHRHPTPMLKNPGGALPDSPTNLTIATTGASGSLFLRHLLLAVDQDRRVKTVNFIASDSALRVMAEELSLHGRSNLVAQLLGHASRKIRQQTNAD